MKVLVASDRPVIREFVVSAIRGELRMEVRDAPDASRELLDSWEPDIVILDLGLAEREIRRLCTELIAGRSRPVVAVSTTDEGLRMLEAGAVGISDAAEGMAGLVATLDTVAGGHTHVPPALLGGILHGLIEQQRRDDNDAAAAVDRLSARERQVLALLAEGCDQRGIAVRLDISPQTAKTHIRHVRHKLGVRSRLEAAAVASEHGLLARGVDDE